MRHGGRGGGEVGTSEAAVARHAHLRRWRDERLVLHGVPAGTTTVVDMWRHMAGSARAASDLGIRAVLVPYVGEHPDHDYFETLDSSEKLIQEWHGGAGGRIHVWVGLEHMFYSTPRGWRRAAEMCERYGVGFHTHSNESRFDVEETERRYGLRPIQALEKFGLLDAPKVLLAHCVWLSEEEIAILARRGIAVAHNPVSNMKLASGAAPVTALRTISSWFSPTRSPTCSPRNTSNRPSAGMCTARAPSYPKS